MTRQCFQYRNGRIIARSTLTRADVVGQFAKMGCGPTKRLSLSVETGGQGRAETRSRWAIGFRKSYRGVLPVVCTPMIGRLAITPTDPFIEALRLRLRELEHVERTLASQPSSSASTSMSW